MPLAPAQGQNERESLCPGRSAVCPERLWAARAQAFSHTPGRSLVLVPEPADRATGRGGGWTEGPAPDAGAELVSLPGDPGVLSAAGRFEKERGWVGRLGPVPSLRLPATELALPRGGVGAGQRLPGGLSSGNAWPGGCPVASPGFALASWGLTTESGAAKV